MTQAGAEKKQKGTSAKAQQHHRHLGATLAIALSLPKGDRPASLGDEVAAILIARSDFAKALFVKRAAHL